MPLVNGTRVNLGSDKQLIKGSLEPREPDIPLEMENLFGNSDTYKRSLTGKQIEII